MKQTLLLLSLLAGIATNSSAQADTINAANNKLQLSRLREAKEVYLVYFTDSALNRKTTGDIWERNTRFTSLNNQQVVEFTWNWYKNDSLMANIVNYCDRATLAPVYHKAVYKKRGTYAYDYQKDFMVPTDSVADNAAQKRGKIALTIPVINWELDLETYPLLPIKKVGQQFDIAFFDPNEKAPSYHRYEVIGKEELQLNNDTKVKCWLLKIDYGKESNAIFWLTEKSREVIKMKEYFRGNYRFKVKLY